MSNTIQSLQAAKAQAQTQQTVQPPKKEHTGAQNHIPQDTVTISKASQQAQAGNTNAVASPAKNHSGGKA